MDRKNLLIVVLILVLVVIAGIWLFRINSSFSNIEKKFSEIKSFSADSTGMPGSKVLYRRPDNYKVVDKDGKVSFLFSSGVFWYKAGEDIIKKINTNLLNEYEKKIFYTQIPPFTSIFYLSLPGNAISFKGKEIINGKEALHFFVDRDANMSRLKIDFWVDNDTGILVKYVDEEGHSDNWSNIEINKSIGFDEFLTGFDGNLDVEDVTMSFKLQK